MDYPESLRYLNSFLNFERMTLPARDRLWNLDRMKFLLGRFGHPEKNFFPVIIAGTKGKGSTGFFLESILGQAGIKAGFYTSPHLVSPRERIRIGGTEVSRREWCKGFTEIRSRLPDAVSPRQIGSFTYFEIMTLLAALVFRRAGVRIALFEVGMGGRLDASNAFDSRMAVITPIHYDHEAILGKTLEKIAREKAAVIRPRMPVVVAPQQPAARKEIIRYAGTLQADLVWVKPLTGTVRVGLAGDFQRVNASVAACAAGLLGRNFGFPVASRAIRQGLRASHWPARFELFEGSPSILMDAAHNPASAEALARNLKRIYPHKDRILIFSAMRDKRTDRMLRALSGYFTRVILTRVPGARCQEIEVLISQARCDYHEVYPAGSPARAFDWAGKLAGKDTLVVVTGSFYLIGEAKRRILHVQSSS